MSPISAVILAAGRSTRMGRPKMLMPWGRTTVLGQVIQTLRSAGIEDLLVVANPHIAAHATEWGVRTVSNTAGEMLASVQLGLQAQSASTEAALICLGDQPQMEERSVYSVCEAFQNSGASLVVPSYRLRRGHPWLAARPLWGHILAMQTGSLRDFLNDHAAQIEYVELNTPTILQDLDTPADYLKYKPPL